MTFSAEKKEAIAADSLSRRLAKDCRRDLSLTQKELL